MTEQSELFQYTIQKLEELKIVYAVVGSFASIAYGEPRATLDIDIVVDLPIDKVIPLCHAFPDPDFYVSQDAVRAAVINKSQFNIIHPDSGNKIDFMISKDDAWSKEQLLRRRLLPFFSDQKGYAARPEDIIISKLQFFAEGGSEKHLRDIAGMLRVSPDEIDLQDVEKWVNHFQLQQPWQAILARLKN